jgi:HD-GYP domain-containing protein (c-di-GMP phosphodiesterase class II)/uncharacterized membrane protein
MAGLGEGKYLQEGFMPAKPLARCTDFIADIRRKHIMWLAIGLIALLGVALVVVLSYGYQVPEDEYSEALLLIGLLAFLTCTVAYFADKEREHRAENRMLIRRLRETAEALDLRVTRLNNLYEASTLLAGNLNIEGISGLVADALAAQVQAGAASLVLVDRATGRCVHAYSAGPLVSLEGERERSVQVARGAAEESGPSLGLAEAADEPNEMAVTWGAGCDVISAPLHISDTLGGALAAIRDEKFSTEELNLLTTLANMASKAIQSADLHGKLEKAYSDLRQSYFKTLHVLVRSLAARDAYSAAHGEVVAALACRLAEKLGLGDEMTQGLRAYGPLHDVGKIGIPDSVLLKNGPLTDEEREMCRQHTLIGEEIVRPLEPSPDVLSIIRSHHERWDGRGYPDRLKGEEIPILARVVAVADAFHAMVSHRAYRGGLLPSSAVREIKGLAGAQFDPAVAQLLVDMWDSGELGYLYRQSSAAPPRVREEVAA